MIRLVGIAFTFFLLAPSAWAKLEIKNIQASHGPYGPERKSLEVCPLDQIYFRFLVEGVKVDEDGKTSVEQSIKLTNSDGKDVFDQKGIIARQLMLGGDTFTYQAFINIGEKAPPGKYTLTVTLTDKIAKETATFTRELTNKATAFQVLAPRFYRDGDNKIPGPCGGLVGETLYFRLYSVGFDRKQKQVKTVMTVQVIDEKGKEVMAKPIVVKADLNNPEEVEKATKATFNGAIILNRAGSFTLRIVVEDQIGKETTKFECPLIVTTP